MSKINYEKLKKSLQRLKEQYANFLTLDQKNISTLDKEAIRESVIHRFEICYDSFFKSLKRHLQGEGVNVESSAPRAILRKANESGLMDQETLDSWFAHIELRIGTTHDYSIEKANKALRKIGNFIEDVENIYKIMCSS